MNCNYLCINMNKSQTFLKYATYYLYKFWGNVQTNSIYCLRHLFVNSNIMKGSDKHQIQKGNYLLGGWKANVIRGNYTGNFNDIYSLKRYYGKL